LDIEADHLVIGLLQRPRKRLTEMTRAAREENSHYILLTLIA
jgi:hypothetical protein